MDSRNIAGSQGLNSELVWLFLLTISTPNDPPLLLVNNNEEVVSRGKTFFPYPFRMQLPDDTGDKLPVVKLQIDNIAGEIIKAIREFTEPPKIKVEMITNLYPDTVEKSLDSLQLRTVNYDSITIQGDLSVVNVLSVKFPSEEYSPVHYPTLFR
jgi:hypothetical protein